MTGQRVLGRLRISRVTEESTSIERQRETVAAWAKSNGHTVVAWAVDEEVSGSVDPFSAPALGPWLSDPEKVAQWDVLCSWKLDRLARNAIAMNRLFGWVRDNDKTLVCVSDNIDLSTWVGRLVANVIAGVAEGELEAIRERVIGSKRKIRTTPGRFIGGRPSYGYRTTSREGGGRALEHNPETAPILNEMVERILAGEAAGSIAADLTKRGVLTPANYFRDKNGTAIRPAAWRTSTVLSLLSSHALLGHALHRGETVRDDDGRPVLAAPPLLTREVFDALQSKIALRRKPMLPGRTQGASPLSGLIVCNRCGSKWHHKKQNQQYAYYLCSGCKDGLSVRSTELEQLLEETFLDLYGDQMILERVFIAGEDHESELREAQEAIDNLARMLSAVRSDSAKSGIERQMVALDGHIADLESKPQEAARYEMRPTGRTYSDEWSGRDVGGRRKLLADSGVTVAVFRPREGGFEFAIRVP